MTEPTKTKLIGIDTGGTYTDAVRYSRANGVEATAKARTESDLTVGIGAALDQVVGDPKEVGLVSLSTTLATNALVQGIGGRVALVFIGFNEGDLSRAGLAEALGDSPVIFAAGGHDSLGNEIAPLDTKAITDQAASLEVDAFAVSSQFSVRDPSHEMATMEALVSLGKPVACSHQLSSKLNGPKRALTCLLNAKLIGLIAELCQAATEMMEKAFHRCAAHDRPRRRIASIGRVRSESSDRNDSVGASCKSRRCWLPDRRSGRNGERYWRHDNRRWDPYQR